MATGSVRSDPLPLSHPEYLMRMRHNLVAWAAVAVLGSAPQVLAGQDRHYVEPVMAGDTTQPPFSQGVLVGNTLYVAGTTGALRGRVPETAAEEARLLMEYLREILADAAMTMDDLVSVQVFSTDLSAIDEFNRVYRTYFTKEYPARAFVGVADLNGSRFELTGVAVRR